MRITLEPWQCNQLPMKLGQPVWLNHGDQVLQPISGYVSAVYLDQRNESKRVGGLEYYLTYQVTPLRSDGVYNHGKCI